MFTPNMSPTLTPAPTRDEAIRTIADYFQPQIQRVIAQKSISITDFARQRFYIPETGDTMRLYLHQTALLDYALDPTKSFTKGGTIIWSCPKKSGKTAIAALVGRYTAETWGTSNEIYMVANDLEQARGRSYQKLLDSIEIDPTYQKKSATNGWKIIERSATFEPNRSIVKALSNDYRGEAGSNPTATFWSELWGYTSEASKRLWEELTPVPTRVRSMRYVETYAGFEDESELLLELYNLGMKGHRLTHDDIDWPFADQPPVWVNEEASIFMYWDSGEIARRMTGWQTPDYYKRQAATLRPNAFDRLHNNLWTSSTEAFMPTEWWEHCRQPLPPITPDTPVVAAADASVSGDCSGIVVAARNPLKPDNPYIVTYKVWYPTPTHPIDLNVMDEYIRYLAQNYNLVECTYDQFQLHKLMTDLVHDGIVWCKVFNQGATREVADKQFYDLVRDRRLVHNAGPEFTEHIRGAASKTNVKEDNRMRIVKKSASTKVDLVVAASMATYECLRLNL